MINDIGSDCADIDLFDAKIAYKNPHSADLKARQCTLHPIIVQAICLT